LGAACADIFEEFFILDDLKKLERGGAGERTAAKGGAMHPGRDARSNVLGGKNGAEREARGERLGNQNDVRLGRKFLISEVAAGAAKSALNFISDQERAVLRGEGASAIPEGFADGINAAFTLN